jgi:sugar phosphate isomerase/epimerase
MPLDSRKIALSLASLQPQLYSEADVARTLSQVRELGYEQVQLWVSHTGVPAARLKQLAGDAGLGICSAHADARAVIEQPARVAEGLSALGCRFGVYPAPHVAQHTLDQVLALADELSRAGEVLRRHGRLLTYHNGWTEFRKLQGKAVLDWLYERSDPILLHAELDTYGVQAGGADPAGYCARLSGRMPLIQLKDYVISPENAPRVAAAGEGNLSIPIILREAEMADCQWYVVAHDAAFAPSLEAAKVSLRYLKSL